MNHDALIEVLPHGDESFLDQVQDLEACVIEDIEEALAQSARPVFVERVCVAGRYVYVACAKADLPACGQCICGRVIGFADSWTACRSPDCGPGARVRAYVREHIGAHAEDGIEPA